MRVLLAAPLLAMLACDSASDATEKTKKTASDAVDATKKVADDASKAGQQAVDASKDAVNASKKAIDASTKAAGDAIDASTKAAGGAKKWWDDIPGTGELSEQTTTWIKNAAASGGRSIENILVESETHAPEAIKIGAALASSVDSDSGFEPIYVKVADTADTDTKIGDMPRVEVIDGLKIGLKRVDSWEGLTQKKERGYLVLWREDDHLIGFVYRSRREIDMAKVAAEVPPLISLVRKAVE